MGLVCGSLPDAIAQPVSDGRQTVAPPAWAARLAGRMYLNAELGGSVVQDLPFRNSLGENEKAEFDPGLRCGFTVGYPATERWAVEFEAGVMVNDVNNSASLGTDTYHVELVQVPLMVSAIYTVPINSRWNVVAGVGGGGVVTDYDYYHLWFEFDPPPNHRDVTMVTYACQGIFGFRYARDKHLDMGVTYKIVAAGGEDFSGTAFDGVTPTHYQTGRTLTHSLLATFTYRF